MNREVLNERLAQLPLYIYDFIDPRELEFSQRIRYICEHDCTMYGTSWACPPPLAPWRNVRKNACAMRIVF